MSTTFWIQLLGIIFGISMIYFTFVKYKRKELTNIELTIWFVIWIVLITAGSIPSIFNPIIEPLNFYRRLDFFVVIGFFVLLGLGFYNYSTVKKMERKLEIFVRKQTMIKQQQHNEEEKKEEQKEKEER